MASLNKVFLMGNLTRDPELRYTPSGTGVCEFGLAINRQWTTPDGQKRDETCFVDCQMWGRSGEVLAEYLKKGSPVFIEGRLQLDQWEGKDGQKRSKMRVVGENFQFIGGRGEGGGGRGKGRGEEPADGGPGPEQPAPQQPSPEQPSPQQPGPQQPGRRGGPPPRTEIKPKEPPAESAPGNDDIPF